MSLTVTHAFVSGKSDGADPTLVQPSNWNDGHVLAQLPGTILGAVAGGSGETVELPVSFTAGGDATFGSTGYTIPAAGTTGQRPVVPASGMFRFNSTTGRFEGYDGSSWSSFLFSGGVPTVQTFTATGADTYTPDADIVWFKVRMWGSGGGGGGSNLGPTSVVGSNGGVTTFNGVNAIGGKGGGNGGTSNIVGGAGGSGGSGATDVAFRLPGFSGGSGSVNATPSGVGGGPGGGASVDSGADGADAAANSSGGGSGGFLTDGGTSLGCPGGGSGEYVELMVTAPAGTYNLTIGAGGAGAVAVRNGGAGSDGLIVIEEYRSP